MLSQITRGSLNRVLAFLFVATSWISQANAQVKLETKFVEGRKTVTHTTMKVKQTLTLGGMGLDTESDRFVISSTQVGKREADGKIRVEQKTDKITTTAKLPGGLTLSFDSDDPNKKADNPALEPFMQLMRAAAKAKTTLVIDQSGKVVAVEGLDQAAEGLPQELRADFNPEQAKKVANQELDLLPADPVKPGDTWSKNADLPLGSGQTMSLTTEYKYVGETKEGNKTLDKIEAKTTAVAFSIAENSALPLKVTKSDLKPTESTTTVLFDREAGQVQSSKGTLHIKGDLDFTINGQALPGKLDLTIESEITRQP